MIEALILSENCLHNWAESYLSICRMEKEAQPSPGLPALLFQNAAGRWHLPCGYSPFSLARQTAGRQTINDILRSQPPSCSFYCPASRAT